MAPTPAYPHPLYLKGIILLFGSCMQRAAMAVARASPERPTIRQGKVRVGGNYRHAGRPHGEQAPPGRVRATGGKGVD